MSYLEQVEPLSPFELPPVFHKSEKVDQPKLDWPNMTAGQRDKNASALLFQNYPESSVIPL